VVKQKSIEKDDPCVVNSSSLARNDWIQPGASLRTPRIFDTNFSCKLYLD